MVPRFVLIVAIAAGAARAGTLDRTVVVGTDVATYFLFHPDDLAHRRTSPMGWTIVDFARGAEFAAGTLVAFDTGGDGSSAIRITDGDLKPREKARVTGSWDFRYKVRHGRVLIDGGNLVPSQDVDKAAPEEDHWLPIANGDYRVTVSTLNRSLPGAQGDDSAFDKTLPAYVIQFRPVKRLDSIKVPSKTPPRLEEGASAELRESAPSWASLLDDTTAELKGSYPAIVSEGSTVTPGTVDHFEVSEAAFKAIDEVEQIVIAPGKTPGVGVLAKWAGGTGSAGGPWHITLQGVRLVKVASVTKGEPFATARVSALGRPGGKVAAAEVRGLKSDFEKYAKADADFRKAEKSPDYQAERVAAIESPTALTNLLLHIVRMPAAERARLLPASDTARIRGLRSFLDPSRKRAGSPR